MSRRTPRCRCGIHLAPDTRTPKCAACARIDAVGPKPPDVPEEFWDTSDMREALATRHMGKVIAAYRQHPFHGVLITQTAMARWGMCTQPNLSRLESGPAVDSISKLHTWATLLGIPASHLWF